MAKLIISLDAEVVQTVQLNKERISLGRHRRNDIVLDHPTVSGQHAVIVTILDDSFLEDLNSTNGSFVNGHRIGKHFLKHQDQIILAKFHIQFVADGVRPFSAAAPALLPAHLELLNGAGNGLRLALSKPHTTLGRAGVQVVVVSRLHDAYAVAHVEGAEAPLLNGAAIGRQAQPLKHGDIIELTGSRVAFTLG